MFVLSNFLVAFAKVLGIGLEVYQWIIIGRVLASWLNPDPFNPIVRFLEQATDPVLAPIRRVIPPMGLDLSPMIVILIIMFCRYFLVQTLYDLAFSLR
ncbi:MAG: YggT family protein [Candidatus Omnitrophica bacterium]|nr:YggT family protein [Candidatus Omnitrophota bacterium]